MVHLCFVLMVSLQSLPSLFRSCCQPRECFLVFMQSRAGWTHFYWGPFCLKQNFTGTHSNRGCAHLEHWAGSPEVRSNRMHTYYRKETYLLALTIQVGKSNHGSLVYKAERTNIAFRSEDWMESDFAEVGVVVSDTDLFCFSSDLFTSESPFGGC